MSLLSELRPAAEENTADDEPFTRLMLHAPALRHTLRQCGSSVLSVEADDKHIYSGSQNSMVSVWDRHLFVLKTTLKGHSGAVLALQLVSDKQWLLSSSSDSTVRIWSTSSLTCLYIVHPWAESYAGDVFSVTWLSSTEMLHFGCQNTSIQFLECSGLQSGETRHAGQDSFYAGSVSSTPPVGSLSRKSKVHKFFNSYPQYERKPADELARNGTQPTRDVDDLCVDSPAAQPIISLEVPAENVVDSAHYGYIYCMAAVVAETHESQRTSSKFSRHLVTGSGDETLKLWHSDTSLQLIHTFDVGRGAVLSVCTQGETIFAGCQDGFVTVWDLETKTLVRAILVQENVAVLSLSTTGPDLYTCSEDGSVQRHSSTFECTASWQAHEGIVLSSIIACNQGYDHLALVTGGSDDQIKVWELKGTQKARPHKTVLSESNGQSMKGTLVSALSAFVSFPSVSGQPEGKEDCRQAAIWLRKFLTQVGADARLLPTSENTNPLVLATFKGTETGEPRPRLLFYGHYDVISAPSADWESDPFVLSGRNGYLYGRGVTDNKGPILAVAFAAAELLNNRALAVDLVFLIEGEEERGSTGFVETVRQHRDEIGHIDAVLVSNSTWIAEYPPCITYGLRGVVHCALEISSGLPDLHSGIEGGAITEPMLDMIHLLSSLNLPDRRVSIPGFYDYVRPISEKEHQLYQVLSGVTQRPASLLSARWSQPSLTVHKIEGSVSSNSTVIPGSVRARVSIRIVPDQKLEDVATSLVTHLESAFAAMQSTNTLSVKVDHKADWWLGSLDDPWFRALEAAVWDEWGIEPLRIREGGSIPSIPFLEKEFGCHALHLPMGQSTDQAHLPNERIALANLQRGQAVIERFLRAASSIALTARSDTKP